MDSDPDGTNIILQLLLLVVLTGINAFFAGAEMALVSVNKNKIKRLSEDGSKNAALILKLLKDSTKFLSTIQVAITFANFFSSASAASGISKMLGAKLESLAVPFSETLSMVIVTILLSFATLVFGELVPKRIALQKAEALSLFAIKPVYFVSNIMAPFIKLLSLSTNLILQIFGLKAENIEEKVSEEEIKALLESGSQQGVFNDIEKEMIQSIFSFDDKIARDVMVPRKDVYVIDIDEPLESYLDELLESRLSKIPIYRDNIDNIIGVLHMKDFYIEARKKTFETVNIEEIMQQPFFVPESKNTDSLFKELQSRKNYLAIIIDEYGGFSGIVTVENLVEEVMGEINNEYEEDEQELVQISEKTYIADGSMHVDELNEKLHLKLEPGNYDTLSGYIIESLGYIPTDATPLEVKTPQAILKIMEMDGMIISKIEIKITSGKE